MIDCFGNWSCPTLEEYKKLEPEAIKMLKASLRYTWFDYKKVQSKLHIPGLYIILNHTTERVYVGRSVDITKRIKSHSTSILKNAILQKHKIIIRIIPCVVNSREWWMETVLIKYYDLRYTSINRRSIAWVRPSDDLNEFKREEYDA